MWIYLVWENVHFAVYLLAALAFLSGLWLYLDAWGLNFAPRKLMGLAGWGLLAMSFFVGAANVELAKTLPFNIPRQAVMGTLPLVRMAGYLLLAASIWLQPIIKKPKVKGLVPKEDELAKAKEAPKGSAGEAKAETAATPPETAPEPLPEAKPLTAVWPLGVTGPWITMFGPAGAAILVALAYLRRATRGLERHVWQAVPVFTLFAGYEAVWLARTWRGSANPTWYKLGAAFGPAWMAEHAILMAASVWLGIWVVRYLLRRLKTQLVLSLTSMSLIIFLVTTVTFSGFALKYMQESAIGRLETDARALNFLIETKAEELLAFTKVVARDPRWVEALQQGDEGRLTALAQAYLASQQATEFVLTDSEGIVLARGDKPEEKGASWSDDPLIQAARAQEPKAGLWKQAGPMAGQMALRAAAPVMVDGQVFAIIWAGSTLDNTFVDGVKNATGLDAAILAGTQLSASSVTVEGEEGRWIGTDLGTEELRQALESKQMAPINRTSTILNKDFLASYLPVRGLSGEAIGFLWIGTPYDAIVTAVGQSVQLTFVVSVLLIAMSLLPSYVVAALISRQVR